MLIQRQLSARLRSSVEPRDNQALKPPALNGLSLVDSAHTGVGFLRVFLSRPQGSRDHFGLTMEAGSSVLNVSSRAAMAMIGVDVSWGTIQGFLIPGIFWGERL